MSAGYTATRPTLNPSFWIIRKPDGRMWRVCHESRIDARVAELNGATR